MSGTAEWLLEAIIVIGLAFTLAAVIAFGVFACVSIVRETIRTWHR